MNSESGDQSHVLLRKHARCLTKWTSDPATTIKVSSELDGKVRIITLSRPKSRNAWNEIMRNEISRALDLASRDPVVRAVIITGDAEGRAFCAGADLSPAGETNPSSMQGDVPDGRKANLQYWRDGGGTAALAIMRSTKPVLAAVNGAAVGVGMTRRCRLEQTLIQ